MIFVLMRIVLTPYISKTVLTWQNVDLSPKKLSEKMQMGQMLSEQMLRCSNDICSNENSFNTLYFKDSSNMAKCRFATQKMLKKCKWDQCCPNKCRVAN